MADRASQTSLGSPEIISTDSPVVACDGGDGPLGHPRVFLRIVGESVVCPYCSRTYVLTEGAHHGHDH
ncbi:MAG TPA: zinc-finger domain-containing protein [Acetobacteraceae bacterium]|jgi:uncharacterized Zn-finger protein|nr:zinc-finger domain-containing protein [Acetobacteraceae bacterium]